MKKFLFLILLFANSSFCDEQVIQKNTEIEQEKVEISKFDQLCNKITEQELYKYLDQKFPNTLTKENFKNKFLEFKEFVKNKPKYSLLFALGIFRLIRPESLDNFIFKSLVMSWLTYNMLNNNKDTTFFRSLGYFLLLNTAKDVNVNNTNDPIQRIKTVTVIYKLINRDDLDLDDDLEISSCGM